MDNSAYVPTAPGGHHLNSPALVVFSQAAAAAAGGLQDALRIQRPFNPQFQMSDSSGKDMHHHHRPFSSAAAAAAAAAASTAFGLRQHMESAYGLPAHILNHLQPQFLHPGLSLGGSGAFRPLSSASEFGKSPSGFPSPSPSAFAPPKCLKIETGSATTGDVQQQQQQQQQHGIFSPNSNTSANGSSDDRYLHGPSPRGTDSCSPASVSLSPQPLGSIGGSNSASASSMVHNNGASANIGSGTGAGIPSAAVKEESLDAHMSSEDSDHPHMSAMGPGTMKVQVSSMDNDSPGLHDNGRTAFRLGPLFGGGFTSGGYSFNVTGLPPAHNINKTGFLFDHVNKKKRDPSCCPVCGLSIPAGDLETHFIHELERLYKLNGLGVLAGRKNRRPTEPRRPPALPGDSGPEGRWETFLRIKTNRQGRLRIKIRKRKADDCPICVGRMHRTQEELNLHNEQCPRNKAMMTDEDETVDVEGDSEFEDWAEGQRRRTSSLLTASQARFFGTIFDMSNIVGRPISSSTGRMSTDDGDAETDDVIVDGDDPEDAAFGPSQYTESDVTANERREKELNTQSQVATVNSSGDVVDVKVERPLPTKEAPTAAPSTSSSASGSSTSSSGTANAAHPPPCDSNVSTSDAEPSSRAQLIEELRNRIRQLEAADGGGIATTTTGGNGSGGGGGIGGSAGNEPSNEEYKCLICLEHYKKPVISTVCWHVHCEECWLHTLGAKKVCPQCSMITTPTDLRRIFM